MIQKETLAFMSISNPVLQYRLGSVKEVGGMCTRPPVTTIVITSGLAESWGKKIDKDFPLKSRS